MARSEQCVTLSIRLNRQAAAALRRVAKRRKKSVNSLISEGVTSVLRDEAFVLELDALLRALNFSESTAQLLSDFSDKDPR